MGVVDELDVFVRGREHVFFADKVKADAHVSELLDLFELGDLATGVLDSYDLQAAVDNLYLEHGEAFLQGFLNTLKNGDLLLNRDEVVVVSKKAAKDVTELHNSHHLLDALTTNVVQNLLKEFLVVVQLEAEVKLRLESFPSVAWLGESRVEYNLFLKVFVERLSARPILAQLDTLNIAGISAPILVDFE